MKENIEKMIAYCGINCAECNAYLATKNNDQRLREITAAEWTKNYDFNFTPEMINCTSCTGSGIKTGYCSQCEIRRCAVEKGVKNCGACKEFEKCETINGFLILAPDLKANLTES
jgi:hypothetical protein